jgi:MFS family permease
MGAVMAVGTAGGPLLGGFIVDSPLGWRWTFFVCVPLAVVALILLQITLKIQHVKRPAKIDWLGSILLTSGVSLLLIWVSFAGNPDYYDWWSWQAALMVGGGVVLLALLVLVESKVEQPIIPLKIISERTTALAIWASVAVGVAMFGSSTFLGQYFQVARGATPTEAGLLTLPMIAGNLIGSVVSGQMISRTGKWKRYLIAGTVLLVGGLGLAGTMDHTTELWQAGVFTAILGLGLGMLLQNLVLAVQNTVSASNIGTASASVAFFRSVGGAIGVSVLGAIMSNRVKELAAQGLADAGIKAGAGSSGASLDLADMPAPIRDIMRAAYGDATAEIFLISAVIAVVALIAVLLIKEQPLRRTVDIRPEAAEPDAELKSGLPAAEYSDDDLEREFAEVLTRQLAGDAKSPSYPGRQPAGEPVLPLNEPPVRARTMLAEMHNKPADLVPLIQETQGLLAEQQLQLAAALNAVAKQAEQQRIISQEQARVGAELKALSRRLAKERKLQSAAVHYIASHGKHRGE